jgi:hypothetical protein
VAMTRIQVTIDQLVLPALEPADRQALVASFQAELSRVLADPASRAAWAQSRRTPVLRLGQLPLGPGPSGSRQLGTSVARALGRGLGR